MSARPTEQKRMIWSVLARAVAQLSSVSAVRGHRLLTAAEQAFGLGKTVVLVR